MTKEQIFLVVVLLSLCCRVQGQKGQVANAGDISCKGSPLLAELTRAPGSRVLSSYGYDLNAGWECARIESPWITGATMLQFRKVGSLYMTLVGDAGVVPIEDPPGQSKPCNLGAECALSFKYPGTDANQTERLYSTWTLTFNPGDGSRPTKLTKVGWLRSFRYAGDPLPPAR